MRLKALRFRCPLVTAILAPLIARAAVLPISNGQSITVDIPSASPSTSPFALPTQHSLDSLSDFVQDATTPSTSFDVDCPNEDEAFEFNFQVLEPHHLATCGHSSLLVNGQPLTQAWTDTVATANEELDLAGHGTSIITAKSRVNGQLHTLEISSDSKCLRPGATDEFAFIEVTSVTILSVDSRSSDSQAGFIVSFDQLSRRVINVTSLSDASQELVIQSDLPAPNSTNEPSFALSLDQEIDRLKTLEKHLEKLSDVIDYQKAYINKLKYDSLKDSGLAYDYRSCDGFQCIINTAFNRAKKCAQMAYLRMKPNGYSPDARPLNTIHEDDSQTALVDGKLYVLIDEKKDDSSSSSSSSSDTSSAPHFTAGDESVKPDEARIHFIAALGALASVLCISCFGFSVIRQCTDPRAKAERAARREERRRAKEYRKLTRRKALADFIGSFRCSRPPPINYDEKRNLVIGQEGVLEHAMQAEIRRLRAEAGLPDVEEGRPSGGFGSSIRRLDSLPAYQSRPGSVRPPSYTTDDAVSEKRRSRPRTVSGSDTTPDSSIAALSPRHSSETLRSERSSLATTLTGSL